MITDLQKLAKIIQRDASLSQIVRSHVLGEVQFRDTSYPLLSFSVGSTNPYHPVLFLTGGFHGLERIGAQVAWSLLKTTVDRLLWDKSLCSLFENLRLIVVPLVNPVGYVNHFRSNGNGVDLMRNSPVDATEKPPYLLGGHRISNKLPWYRGTEGTLEFENKLIEKLFKDEVINSDCVVSMDFHSGFGMRDRLWFPHSYTSKPFDHLPEFHALLSLLEQTHPYHIYHIEPQSRAYLLSGDIWDHLYLLRQSQNMKTYIPLTLEMGSWNWVRKNPLQIFSRHGAFNPMKEHRVKRTYRRHHLLFDFLLKALYSNEVWATLDTSQRAKHSSSALERWY
ncbi:MAG: M14 family zinc carboxypeptidase [Bdellovibrionota bacterium]